MKRMLALGVLPMMFLASKPLAQLPKHCETCWDDSCADLKIAFPRCSNIIKKSKVKSASASNSQPACPEGKSISVDSRGHCCWSDQAWNGSKCVGRPTNCPDGYEIDKINEACVLPSCASGKSREPGKVNCCWPEQAYSNFQKRCIGRPKCPDGMLPTDDDRCKVSKTSKEDVLVIRKFFSKYQNLKVNRENPLYGEIASECKYTNKLGEGENVIGQSCLEKFRWENKGPILDFPQTRYIDTREMNSYTCICSTKDMTKNMKGEERFCRIYGGTWGIEKDFPDSLPASVVKLNKKLELEESTLRVGKMILLHASISMGDCYGVAVPKDEIEQFCKKEAIPLFYSLLRRAIIQRGLGPVN